MTLAARGLVALAAAALLAAGCAVGGDDLEVVIRRAPPADASDYERLAVDVHCAGFVSLYRRLLDPHEEAVDAVLDGLSNVVPRREDAAAVLREWRRVKDWHAAEVRELYDLWWDPPLPAGETEVVLRVEAHPRQVCTTAEARALFQRVDRTDERARLMEQQLRQAAGQ